jgi:hypothetical protein
MTHTKESLLKLADRHAAEVAVKHPSLPKSRAALSAALDEVLAACDEYKKCADDQAMAHKIERDGLMLKIKAMERMQDERNLMKDQYNSALLSARLQTK